MKLYFIRHASASDIASSDAERELTKEGREEARVAGTALARLGARPSRVFSSPLARARQTAEIVVRTMRSMAKVEVATELTNDTATTTLVRFLKKTIEDEEIVLVGHAPGLSIHIAALIGAKDHEGLPLGKGGIACVELDQLQIGKGELRWLMRQRQLKVIAQ